MRKQVVVMAAGEGKRFGEGRVPKHLVHLGGEPLLRRLVRLWGHHFNDISVIVPPELLHEYQSAVKADIKFVCRYSLPSNNSLKFEEAIRWWDGESDLVIVYGDVFFTSQAVASIHDEVRRSSDLLFFCRFGPSLITGSTFPELFAVSVPLHHVSRFRTAVEEVNTAYTTGVLWRDGGWEIAKRCAGVSFRDMRRHQWLDLYRSIDDLTDDIDFFVDYQRLDALVPEDLDEAINRLSQLAALSSKLITEGLAFPNPCAVHSILVSAVQGRVTPGDRPTWSAAQVIRLALRARLLRLRDRMGLSSI